MLPVSSVVQSKLLSLVVILGFFISIVFSSLSYAKLTEESAQNRPALLLLAEFSAQQSVKGWLMSEKLDGVRAYWNGRQLLSRNGHVFYAPKWFTKKLPPFELDGELWIDRGQFEEVVSVVRRKHPDDRWRRVTYQIFEVPNQSGFLLERLSILKKYLAQTPVPHLKVIEQTVIQNESEVQQNLQRVLEMGGEGLVLRKANSLYYTGRSKEAVKVKLKQDAECMVVGYTEGKGKYQGKTGALKCQLLAEQFPQLKAKESRLIKIGSGLSDQLRETPPLVGQTVTFQYMGLTRNGLPRFPVFLRLR